MDDIDLSNAILYADSARGVYIPQYFAESINRECVGGLTDLCWSNLTDGNAMESDYYWDTWTHVLDNTIVTDPSTGVKYGLYQNGDLWLVPLADLCASDLDED